MAPDKDGNVMNVKTHTIQEAMNSETHKQHRKENEPKHKAQKDVGTAGIVKKVHKKSKKVLVIRINLKKIWHSKRQRVIRNTSNVIEYI